jgi:hypothetical protein
MNDSNSIEFNLHLISSEEILYIEFKALIPFIMKQRVVAGQLVARVPQIGPPCLFNYINKLLFKSACLMNISDQWFSHSAFVCRGIIFKRPRRDAWASVFYG